MCPSIPSGGSLAKLWFHPMIHKSLRLPAPTCNDRMWAPGRCSVHLWPQRRHTDPLIVTFLACLASVPWAVILRQDISLLSFTAPHWTPAVGSTILLATSAKAHVRQLAVHPIVRPAHHSPHDPAANERVSSMKHPVLRSMYVHAPVRRAECRSLPSYRPLRVQVLTYIVNQYSLTLPNSEAWGH